MSIDVLALLPALDAHELTGLGDAFMHVVGETAVLAAGGGNTFQGCGNEARPGIRTNAGPRDDDNRI